jgi:hypothetical protein
VNLRLTHTPSFPISLFSTALIARIRVFENPDNASFFVRNRNTIPICYYAYFSTSLTQCSDPEHEPRHGSILHAQNTVPKCLSLLDLS